MAKALEGKNVKDLLTNVGGGGAAIAAAPAAGFIPDVQQEAVQVQTLISLVESGLGIALVPSVAARHATRQLVFRPLGGAGSRTAIGLALAMPPGGATSAAERFRESVVESVASV